MLESNTLVSYSPKLSYDPAHVYIRVVEKLISLSVSASLKWMFEAVLLI
ncbi:hypothetical protein LEP1GSC038_1703 [Leptospira weilii str. 2006001855]|uniref:Uncharacterized protein n=1 Tax=Leptospira weilii str. 2006001855 TaxID=996804 RepID=M6FIP9_9LEPT|nr:hypothetical protein LEP1GSC038_1703 [Leptospira weilii str. 2006001855]